MIICDDDELFKTLILICTPTSNYNLIIKSWSKRYGLCGRYFSGIYWHGRVGVADDLTLRRLGQLVLQMVWHCGQRDCLMLTLMITVMVALVTASMVSSI